MNFLGDPLRVSDPDPHQSEKADPHQSQKKDLDPNLHQTKNSGAVETQNEAMEVIITFRRSKIRVRMKVISDK